MKRSTIEVKCGCNDMQPCYPDNEGYGICGDLLGFTISDAKKNCVWATVDKSEQLLKELRANNPYPEDVFTEPTKDEYAKVQKLFIDAGLIQDRFFGAYGRKVWNNCIEKAEEIAKDMDA